MADLLLLEQGGQWYALEQGQFALDYSQSIDPGRRLFTVTVNPGVTPVVSGERAAELRSASLNRGALGCAAQALGLKRSQDEELVAVNLEYAKAPVHRAAYAVAQDAATATRHVAHAKLAACEAANLAAKHSIQVHGAMGYTWEVDLHIFMKKAWALANTWGDAGFHKQQVAQAILAEGAVLGAGATFQ